MARKTYVELIDDIDGTSAAETVAFGLDGKSYSIDLSDENAEKLREALAPFVDAAAVEPRTKAKAPGKKPSGEAGKIRAWARENGYEIGNRGAIPAEIRDAYAAA